MLVNKEDIKNIRDLLVCNLVFLKKESFIYAPGEELAKIEEKIRATRHYIRVLESMLRYENNQV